MDVASQLLRRLRPEIRRCVQVGLAANDHTDVRVQVNPAGLAGHKSATREFGLKSRTRTVIRRLHAGTMFGSSQGSGERLIKVMLLAS